MSDNAEILCLDSKPPLQHEVRELTIYPDWCVNASDEEFRGFAENPAYRANLCFTMKQWALQPLSLTVMGFCRTYKIQHDTLKDWTRKYPDVEAAFNQMKKIIADNRIMGCGNAWAKKLEPQVFMKDMHVLDPDWLEINKYNADLKKTEDRGNVGFTVLLTQPPVQPKEDFKKEVDRTLIQKDSDGA